MVCNTDDIANKQWVRGLRNQSHEVFEEIFKTFYADLYKFAYAYLMNENLAEDAGCVCGSVDVCRVNALGYKFEKLSLFFSKARVFGLFEAFTSN